MLGFYFWPYVLQNWRSATKIDWLLAAGASVAFVALFKPEYSHLQGPGLFTGLVFHAVHIVEARQAIAGWTTTALLAGAGIVTIMLLLRSPKTASDQLLLVVLLLLTVPYLVSTQIGERHLLGLVFVLFLLVLPRMRAARAMWYAAYVALLGSSYFFYWIFFKFS